MASPRHRHDGYGKPLPTLADARHEVLIDTENNRTKRRDLQMLIEEYLRDLLCRGMNAKLMIHVIIADGSIQGETWVQVDRLHGGKQGWRKPGEGR
jgi:hypothetical protein